MGGKEGKLLLIMLLSAGGAIIAYKFWENNYS